MNKNDHFFETIYQYIQEHTVKNSSNWFSCIEIFKHQGKQGVAGIATIPELNTTMVFKIPQCLNYLSIHEWNVLQGLNDLKNYCPHFCKGYGVTKLLVDKNYKKSTNPFHVTSATPIEVDVLFMEHIVHSKKFYNYIKSKKISDHYIFSLVKQTLMAITIAQKKKEFAHYDLQSNNIFIQKCNPNEVFLYIIDDSHSFVVPSYGLYPVIIDTGYSYIKDLKKQPVYASNL